MKKYYRLAGCFTCFFQLVGIVFYVILMVTKFNAGVDWLTGFFLIYGLVGIVLIGSILVNTLFGLACRVHKCECEHYNYSERQ